MSLFRISQRAETDLAEIHRYLAERNPSAAVKLISEFFDLFHLLVRNPECGQSRGDLRLTLRSISHGNYVVFFYATADSVEIAAVIHGAREVDMIFGKP